MIATTGGDILSQWDFDQKIISNKDISLIIKRLHSSLMVNYTHKTYKQ